MLELFVTSVPIGAGLLAGAITLWTAGELLGKVCGFVESRIKIALIDAKTRRIRRLDREHLRRMNEGV